MSRYRKLDPRLWNDEKVRRLTDHGKLAFLFRAHTPGHDRPRCHAGHHGGAGGGVGLEGEAIPGRHPARHRQRHG